MSWRIITDTRPLSGAENMARDEAILKAVEEGIAPPTIRLYRWSPSCISLGKHQNPTLELDIQKIKKFGFEVVKRFTGGRAVFHADEVTYSVIACNDVAPWAAKLQETYTEISQWLVKSMSELSTNLLLEKGELVIKTPRGGVAPACFASTAKSEIVVSGKKLVGSAQRRTRKAFLQHGSILVGPQHLEIANLLKLEESAIPKYMENLKANSSSLQEAGIFIEAQKLQEILNEGLLNLFKLNSNGSYLDSEEKMVENIRQNHVQFLRELL